MFFTKPCAHKLRTSPFRRVAVYIRVEGRPRKIAIQSARWTHSFSFRFFFLLRLCSVSLRRCFPVDRKVQARSSYAVNTARVSFLRFCLILCHDPTAPHFTDEEVGICISYHPEKSLRRKKCGDVWKRRLGQDASAYSINRAARFPCSNIGAKRLTAFPLGNSGMESDGSHRSPDS